MIKVAFNTRYLKWSTTRGFNRYTINLLQGLIDLDVNLFLYSDGPLHPLQLEKLPQDSYQVRVAPAMPYILWEQHWLKKQCKEDQIDILHSPINFGLPWLSPCPCILTLHDTIEQVYNYRNSPWYTKINLGYNIRTKFYPWMARTIAERIITVSDYSKQDIVKQFRGAEDKITVIYGAADTRFHQEVNQTECLLIRQKYQLTSPYIFYVGGCEKRKNVPFLIKAFAQANLDNIDLVIAGGYQEQCDILSNLAASLNISRKLRLLGIVDDEDLRGLYADAICFVNPSEYEGFGLQLCESMAVGCPVLAARSTSLPEVLGNNGGEIFSLSDMDELIMLLQRITSDESYRNQLAIQAKKRGQEFNWQISAQQTKDVYLQVLNQNLANKILTN